MTPRTLFVPALAAAVLAVAASAAAGGVQIYAKGVPLCRPARHHAACDAMRRVLVREHTQGARPLTELPAGTMGPAGGLTPADITSVYKLKGNGGGQTVAIVDAYNDPK